LSRLPGLSEQVLSPQRESAGQRRLGRLETAVSPPPSVVKLRFHVTGRGARTGGQSRKCGQNGQPWRASVSSQRARRLPAWPVGLTFREHPGGHESGLPGLSRISQAVRVDAGSGWAPRQLSSRHPPIISPRLACGCGTLPIRDNRMLHSFDSSLRPAVMMVLEGSAVR
jgi:hypothetical protein